MRCICPDPHMPVHQLAANAALGLEYLTNYSSKLGFVLGVLQYHCVCRGEKVLIIVEWELVSWLVEVVLYMTGVRVEAVYSNMASRDRGEVLQQFDDPSSDLKVLTGTARAIGKGQNLQQSCHVLLILEPQSSLGATQHIIGRVHRLGQARAQTIYIATCEYSYDVKRLASSVRAFVTA